MPEVYHLRLKTVAPAAGFEPATLSLTGTRATTAPRRNMG